MSDLFLRRAFPGLTCREGVPVEEKTAVFIDILFVLRKGVKTFGRRGHLLEAVGEVFLRHGSAHHVVIEEYIAVAVNTAVNVPYLVVDPCDPVEHLRVKIRVTGSQPLGAERELLPKIALELADMAYIIDVRPIGARIARVGMYRIIGVNDCYDIVIEIIVNAQEVLGRETGVIEPEFAVRQPFVAEGEPLAPGARLIDRAEERMTGRIA